MDIVFFLSAAVAVLSTIMVITRLNAMHALLYLIVSLLSVALMFFTLGAPFVGMLEIIIYAGAIMVLFLFGIMLLNLGPASVEQERRLMKPGIWTGPSILVLILFAELIYVLYESKSTAIVNYIGPDQVGIALFSRYLLGVELASFLLLSGLIGAYHLGRRSAQAQATEEIIEAEETPGETTPIKVWSVPEKPAEREQRHVFQPDYPQSGPEDTGRAEGEED